MNPTHLKLEVVKFVHPIQRSAHTIFVAPDHLQFPIHLNGEAKLCPGLPTTLHSGAQVYGIELPPRPGEPLMWVGKPEAKGPERFTCRVSRMRVMAVDPQKLEILTKLARNTARTLS